MSSILTSSIVDSPGCVPFATGSPDQAAASPLDRACGRGKVMRQGNQEQPTPGRQPFPGRSRTLDHRPARARLVAIIPRLLRGTAHPRRRGLLPAAQEGPRPSSACARAACARFGQSYAPARREAKGKSAMVRCTSTGANVGQAAFCNGDVLQVGKMLAARLCEEAGAIRRRLIDGFLHTPRRCRLGFVRRPSAPARRNGACVAPGRGRAPPRKRGVIGNRDCRDQAISISVRGERRHCLAWTGRRSSRV